MKKYLFAWMLVVSAVAIQSCNTEKAQENDVAKSEGKSDSIAMDHGKMDGMHDMHETRLTGDIDFDFATLMMEHHQGAVDMAKSVLAKGANAEVRVIAQNIVTAQEAEIAQFKNILKNYSILENKNQNDLNGFSESMDRDAATNEWYG